MRDMKTRFISFFLFMLTMSCFVACSSDDPAPEPEPEPVETYAEVQQVQEPVSENVPESVPQPETRPASQSVKNPKSSKQEIESGIQNIQKEITQQNEA